MKHQWQPEELVEQFTLLPDEITLLEGKTGTKRLGFAVLLKFFQLEARFPQTRQGIPKAVISYIAKQLDLSPRAFREYEWQGRSIKRHRAEIREHFGFREFTSEDSQDLTEWLQREVLIVERQKSRVEGIVYDRLRELKLEPPASERMKRLIDSTMRRTEDSFCEAIAEQLSPHTRTQLDELLNTEASSEEETLHFKHSVLSFLKSDPGRASLESILTELEKLRCLRQLELPPTLLANVAPKIIQHYRRRASAENPRELRRHRAPLRYTLMAAFCWQRAQEITDALVDLLIQIIHRIHVKAERRVNQQLIEEFKRVNNKDYLLYQIASASLERPEAAVQDVVYPIASPKVLQALVKEYKSNRPALYEQRVYTIMRASYLHHYRRMVPQLLEILEFHSNNQVHRPVIEALELLKRYQDSQQRLYPAQEKLYIKGVLKSGWRELIVETDAEGHERINRVNYEICVLHVLREKLRCKEIWVSGAKRYGNPEADLPQDFEQQRESYYQSLKQPLDATQFIERLQQSMTEALTMLDQGLPKNQYVRIVKRKKPWIQVTPLEPQPEPLNLARLKTEISRRWPLTSLLDMLKEVDLRVGFTDRFSTSSTYVNLSPQTLQRRLLLCLYGLGTNTGLKRICAGIDTDDYTDLRYVKRHFISKEELRNAIAQVVNAIFQIRLAPIWGEGTTACASDAKKFSAWDQNLMTEWHVRYRGRGVTIYWHVERKSACIYSQLKTCSSSEVAAMIEGLLRHCTDAKVQKNYVDTHGQSEVAFAFCHLLGFELMPRIKRIGEKRLYLPHPGQRSNYPNLQPVLAKVIDWELIRQQYDQMMKFAMALKLGTAEAETILRRFNRATAPLHPTHRALIELGKAVRTIFLCHYLHSLELRREIHEGLNVVEQWNGANGFIFYGKSSEIATNRLDEQELSMLALHLLQISLVYINTLMIQRVLAEPVWMKQMGKEELRGLTPLIWGHVNPYGSFHLDLNERLRLDAA